MIAYLDTIQPDLVNMTRVFDLPDSVWDDPARFRLTCGEEGGSFWCAWTDGERSVRRTAAVPSDSEADARVRELHRRRTARRLCRQTLYELCREVTGVHPPWGSLTGIRPTRLVYEALERGAADVREAAKRVSADFDVTEEKAELLAETVESQLALPPAEDGWMDVYIGIPFCTTRCTYCSFSSGELGDGRLVEPYLAALFAEMRAGGQLIRETGRRIRAVYIGGGTPTSLDADQLRRLLAETRERFGEYAEMTVEAGRPDTITREKLRVIRDSGAGRISINPQTMNDQTLRVIGRAHTAAQVTEAYALAREEGLRHINMDVIAGLPGEHPADFARTMEAALRLRPESLTVHTLAIKRSSRLHLENAPLPDAAEAAEMVRMGMQTAHALGQRAYYLYRQKHMAGHQENVGYALPGHACLYNVDIMEENTHILAFGAGGISKRIYSEEGHIGRAPNVSSIAQYIGRWEEMAERKRQLFTAG